MEVEIWPLRLEARDWAACGGRKKPSANKPQTHVSAATPTKSAKLHAKTFNILNFKKWLVTASGGGVGGVRGGASDFTNMYGK